MHDLEKGSFNLRASIEGLKHGNGAVCITKDCDLDIHYITFYSEHVAYEIIAEVDVSLRCQAESRKPPAQGVMFPAVDVLYSGDYSEDTWNNILTHIISATLVRK